MKTLADAFHHTLQDICYAENALVRAGWVFMETNPIGKRVRAHARGSVFRFHANQSRFKALPKVAAAAGNADFKALVQAHLNETRQQIPILDKVIASIKQKPVGLKCDAIEGLIKETEGIIKDATGLALDASLIAAAQAVEHYEIARYGALREWAKVLGHTQAHDLLSEILDMEKAANSKLTSVAVAAINMGKKIAA